MKFKPSCISSINQVVSIATTTTSVAPSKNPASINQPVTYTAYVASQYYGGAVTGTVTFQDGGVPIATAALAYNRAAFTTSYQTRGIHAITGTYSGDSNNVGSVSAALMEQVSGFGRKQG